MELQGKNAIVTGAIKGIGRAVAKALLEEGARVAAVYFDWLESLDEMHRALRGTGGQYIAVSADLRQRGDAKRVVEEAVRAFGGLELLVLNVERGGWPAVHGPYTEEQWELEFSTTITAKWNLMREALPILKAGGGAVVVMSSISGETGRAGPAAPVFAECYSLSNRALSLLVRQWAREGAPEVRVNELALGFVETRHGPGTRGWEEVLTPEEKEALLRHTLLRRAGTLQDVVKAVLFLLRDADFMTGARVVLDGGYLLGGEPVPPVPKGVVAPGEPTWGGRIRPGERA